MKKAITFSLVTVLAGFTILGFLNSLIMQVSTPEIAETHKAKASQTPPKKNTASEVVSSENSQEKNTDQVSIEQAAIAPATVVNDDEQILEVAKSFNLGSLNEQILENVMQMAPEKKELQEYVKSFPFEEEFIKELKKLHPEDLNIIAEVERHEVTTALNEKEEEINKLMKNFSEKGEIPVMTMEKVNLINEINDSLNANEANKLLVGSIIETSLAYSLSIRNEKLNQAEISAMAQEKAQKILNSRKDYLKKSVAIPYSVLSTEQLKEYANYLQKVEAGKASKLSTNSLIPVFKKFSKGMVKLMKK